MIGFHDSVVGIIIVCRPREQETAFFKKNEWQQVLTFGT